MIPVTQYMKLIRQPRGGYLPPKSMDVDVLETEMELNPQENVIPTLVGLVVDYLTRFTVSGDKYSAFSISLAGTRYADAKVRGQELIEKIEGLDSVSIVAACHLVAYDVVVRAGRQFYKPIEDPDKDTVLNIRIMVERSIAFFKKYGEPVLYGFGFPPTGQFKIYGDGDFITKDTLWDFKVSKYIPTTKHTLQLLLYYSLGLVNPKYASLFSQLKYLGVYNPRLNKVFRIEIKNIPEEHLREIRSHVL